MSKGNGQINGQNHEELYQAYLAEKARCEQLITGVEKAEELGVAPVELLSLREEHLKSARRVFELYQAYKDSPKPKARRRTP